MDEKDCAYTFQLFELLGGHFGPPKKYLPPPQVPNSPQTLPWPLGPSPSWRTPPPPGNFNKNRPPPPDASESPFPPPRCPLPDEKNKRKYSETSTKIRNVIRRPVAGPQVTARLPWSCLKWLIALTVSQCWEGEGLVEGSFGDNPRTCRSFKGQHD